MGQYGLMGNYSADPSLGKFGGLQQGSSIQSTQKGMNPFMMMALMKMLGGQNQQQEIQPQSSIINPPQQPNLPINLMGFPSMAAGNINYGDIIAKMLSQQRGF